MSAPRAGGLTLALDASTYVGTVAVIRGGSVLAERAAAMRGRHEERLMPEVAAALGDAGARVGDVAAVVCGGGPGSFTSLRIAASIAKGMALGLGVSLHAVSSLGLVVAGARPPLPPGAYLAALDALRGECYVTAVRLGSDGYVSAGEPRLARREELEAEAVRVGARLVGPGQGIDVAPHARGAARMLPAVPDPRAAVELVGWEPTYGRQAEAQVKWEAAHGRALPR